MRGFRTPRKNMAHLVGGTPSAPRPIPPLATPFDPLAPGAAGSCGGGGSPLAALPLGRLHNLLQSLKWLRRNGYRLLPACHPC